MSCQCYQIGGPFIAEDPDCAVHGSAAGQRERDVEALKLRAQAENDPAERRKKINAGTFGKKKEEA